VLDLRPRGVRSLRAAVFLEGYAEPLLLLLHEAEPTWAGRLALRRDTCSLAAFSLGLGARRATRIWADAGLPSDCAALAAVPPPAGGALVLGASWLLYRSGAGVGLQLALQPASLGTPDAPGGELGESGLPLPPPLGAGSCNPPPRVAGLANCALSPLACSLRAARLDWADPGPVAAPQQLQALLCTAAGALLQLRLPLRGREVLSLALCAARPGPPEQGAPPPAEAPAPSCLRALAGGGGGGGPLFFLGSRCSDGLLLELLPPRHAQPLLLTGGGGEKRPREEEDEEAALYGGAPAPPPPLPAPGAPPAAAAAAEAPLLLLRDSLPCLAPALCVAAGEAPLPGEGSAARPELLLGCGAGAAGALAALHRSVVPELLAAVPLPGVRGAWALHSRRAGEAAPPPGRVHDFLLLSTAAATLVFACSGEELAEVTDRAEFAAGLPTLAAGALFGGARLAQVTPQGVRLCAATVRAQEVGLPALAPPAPAGASVRRAAVVHPFVLLHLSDGTLRLLQGSAATNRVEALGGAAAARLQAAPFAAAALLDDAAAGGGLAAALALRPPPAHFLLAASSEGALQIFALPSCARVFDAPGLGGGAQVLRPRAAPAARGSVDAVRPPAEATLPPPPRVAELLALGGPAVRGGAALAALREDGELFLYSAFAAPGEGGGLRLLRLPLGAPPAPPGEAGLPGQEPPLTRLVALPALRALPGEPGCVTGLLALLPRAPALLCLSRGRWRQHPLWLPPGCAGYAAAAPFHNANCPHGLVLAAEAAGEGGALRIVQLAAGLELGAGWPHRRAPLGCTPVALAYAPEARCFAAVLAPLRPFRAREVEAGDGQGAAAAALAAARAELAGGQEEAHELRLLAPGSLAAAPWALQLQPGESCLALCPLPLRNTASGELVPVLALGTGFLAGEDCPCRGRLLLLQVAWAAEGGGGVARQGRLLLDRPYKSAITALSPLEGQHKGYVLMAVGTKLGVHAWDGAEMRCVAFFDTPSYVVGLAAVRNFVLLGDVTKGLSFLRWKDAPAEKLLVQLAKTFERLDFAAGELLLDGATLSLLAVDVLGVLHTYAFAPGAVEAWMGQRLLPRARFATQRAVGAALRLRCPGAEPRSGALLSCADGGLAAVTPLPEAAKAQLLVLQAEMALRLPHEAGLNPAAQRAPRERQGRVGLAPCSGTMVDGPLLARFLEAPWAAQHALALAAGAPRAQLVAAVREAQASTSWLI